MVALSFLAIPHCVWRPRRFFCAAIFLAALGARASAFAQPLQVTPDTIDFGVVRPGVDVRRVVQVRNGGDEEAVVWLQVPSGPFAVAVETLHVAAAAGRDVAVTFSAADTGLYAGQLAVQVRALFGSQSVDVPLAARVERGRLTVRPGPDAGVDVGPVAVGGRGQASVELVNAGRVELAIDTILVVPYGAPFALSSAPPRQLSSGARVQLDVDFAPLAEGPSQAHLEIRSADVAGGSVAVPLAGHGLAPHLAVSPLPEVGVDFDSVEVGAKARRVLTLLNHGRSDLAVSLAVTDERFRASPDSILHLEPGGRREVAITLWPRYEGPISSALVLRSNDPARPELTLPLTAHARVRPPQVEVLSPNPIRFGSVPLGKPAKAHLLLWNRGGSPCTVRLGLEGDPSPEFVVETGSILLQPGASAAVGLSFQPKEVGDRAAALWVETESGSTQLRLQGTGRFLKLSPSSFDFERVPVGESSRSVVDLVNVGNADFTISRILSTSDDFTVYSQVSPESEILLPANSLRSLPLSVTFAPSSRGPRTGTLRLEGFWEEGTETLELLLGGTGVAAQIELHPSGPLEFGYVVLGESETRTLVATNTGDTSLQVRANSLTREARIDPEAFALEPGQATTLRVRFAPEALGERFGQVLLVSNDVRDKAQAIQVHGQGSLESIDLAEITTVVASRKGDPSRLPVAWNSTPLVVHDGTKLDLRFEIPDSLRQALVGRRIDVEWTQLDANYDPKGSARLTRLQIYEDSEGSVLAEDLNLRLTEAENRRVRLKLTTSSYPEAPPQSVSQVIEAGGWKWEFEAKPLVSFLTIRPGRDVTDRDGNRLRGRTERLIGLPGIAFAGWHNSEHPAISGVHLTAIGNVLEALSTDNSIAVSLGLALSLYKDRFLFGFGWDVYDSRSRAKRRGTQDYILTFKYSGLF